MKPGEMTLEDIRDVGMSALFDALGPANALRFLQLFQPGTGDYTRDRHAWLDGLSLDDIMADVREIQQASDTIVGDTPPETNGRAR